MISQFKKERSDSRGDEKRSVTEPSNLERPFSLGRVEGQNTEPSLHSANGAHTLLHVPQAVNSGNNSFGGSRSSKPPLDDLRKLRFTNDVSDYQ